MSVVDPVQNVYGGAFMAPQEPKSIKESLIGYWKLNTAVDAVFKMADTAKVLPGSLQKVFFFTKLGKVANGVFSISDLYMNIKKSCRASDRGGSFQDGWKAVENVRDIANGADSACKLLKEHEIVSEKALVWIKIKDIALVPIALISSLNASLRSGEKVEFLRGLRRDIKAIKQACDKRPQEAMRGICEMLRDQMQRLKNAEVVNDQGQIALSARLKNLIARLDANEDGALRESKRVVRCIKDRLTEQVGSSIIDAAITIGKFITSIFKVLTRSADIISVVTGTLAYAEYRHKMCIPKGDIGDSESRMLYARIFKVASRIIRIFRAVCNARAHIRPLPESPSDD